MSNERSQSFPLFVTVDGKEFLVVGWTNYNTPYLVPLDRPVAAQAETLHTHTVVTYQLNQWTPPPVQAASVRGEMVPSDYPPKSFYPAGQHGPRHHETPTDYPQGRQV